MDGNGRLRLDRGISVILLYASLAALVVALYFGTFRGLNDLWAMSRYQYGYVVLPIAAYMLWLRRDRLASLPLRPALLAFVLLPILALAWVVARSTSIQVVEQLAVLAMIPAAGLAVGGWRAFRSAAFPLLFVIAALPIGDGLVPQLMLVTAAIAEGLLQLIGVPTYRQGMIFVLPGGSFEVADICAGLQYLLSSTFVAILFAQLTYQKTWKRIAFVAIAMAGAIVANALRAFIVMAVASATEMRWLGGDDHIYFGHVLFAAMMLVLFFAGMRFKDPAPAAQQPVSLDAAGGTAWRWVAVAWLAAALLLAAGRAVDARRQDLAAGPQPSVQLPSLDACEGPLDWRLDWQPRMPSPDVQTAASYTCGQGSVHLYVAAYRTQAQGRELVSEGNELVARHVLARLGRGTSQFEAEDGGAIRVSELSVTETGGVVTIWYWYSVNGTATSSSLQVKLREALAAVMGRPVLSAVHLAVVESPAVDGTAARVQLEQASRQLWAHYRQQEPWRGGD